MSCNLIIPPLLLSVLLLSLPSRAEMVVYTDPAHTSSGVTGDTRVVWLDALEQLQQSLFGNLPETPKKKNAGRRLVGWQPKQTELAQAYRGLLHAWPLGLKNILLWCLTTRTWFMALPMWWWPKDCSTVTERGGQR